MPKPIISSVKVERVGAHDHVHIWSRGGKAGVLIVCEGDGETIAARLQNDGVPLAQLIVDVRRIADLWMADANLLRKLGNHHGADSHECRAYELRNALRDLEPSNADN